MRSGGERRNLLTVAAPSAAWKTSDAAELSDFWKRSRSSDVGTVRAGALDNDDDDDDDDDGGGGAGGCRGGGAGGGADGGTGGVADDVTASLRERRC